MWLRGQGEGDWTQGRGDGTRPSQCVASQERKRECAPVSRDQLRAVLLNLDPQVSHTSSHVLLLKKATKSGALVKLSPCVMMLKKRLYIIL